MVIGGLLTGCKVPQPPPEKPAVSIQELDAKISARRQTLNDLINQPRSSTDGRSKEDLKKEIQERQARIKFLQGEIDALLRQRAAAEIYYRQKDTSH